jgi:hypothetical protein
MVLYAGGGWTPYSGMVKVKINNWKIKNLDPSIVEKFMLHDRNAGPGG